MRFFASSGLLAALQYAGIVPVGVGVRQQILKDLDVLMSDLLKSAIYFCQDDLRGRDLRGAASHMKRQARAKTAKANTKAHW